MITADLLIHLLVVLLYIVFWAAGFIIFYHLTRFGIGIHPKRLAAIFFIGSISLFIMSVVTFSKIDISFLNTVL